MKGVSVGDAFGESFFGDHDSVIEHISRRTVPESKWEFSDDTIMALSVFEELEDNRTINQDSLIKRFVQKHDLDVNRGYGATTRRMLREVGEGGDWRVISNAVFDGMGSMGNGAAMRVGTIGAYFHDDLELVAAMAKRSAEVTHANIEAIAGAVAIAKAVAIATQSSVLVPEEFIEKVVFELPESDVKSRIKKSTTVSYTYHIDTVISILGNGTKIQAQDTVPFCVWCAAHNLGSFEEALWKAVSALGDRDTICAMVAGITIMSSDEDQIPRQWFDQAEDFESSIFRHLTT
ncbi:MAG: ADP-ribosylglycohydrolase family protein [Bacteroidota bacterium]